MNTGKKTLGLALAGLFIMVAGMVTPSHAVQISDDIRITVTVNVVSVAVSSAAWDIAQQLSPSQVTISSQIAVANDGNVQEYYSLDLTVDASGWDASADAAPGTDEFALLALFKDSIPSVANFEDEDTIEDAPAAATAAIFALAADPDGEAGFDVTTGAPNRKLFLAFKAPSTNTLSAQQVITVTVTAAAS